MKGSPVQYEDVVVYPEYCELSIPVLRDASGDGRYHIAALPALGSNLGVAVRQGDVVWTRSKCRLHPSEKGVAEGRVPPCSIRLGALNVLILICYEVLFPQDYLLQALDPSEGASGQVNLIVHMVGSPMHNEEQREGWVAMQEALSLLFDCPLVCCCGGKSGGMNISRILERGGGKR